MDPLEDAQVPPFCSLVGREGKKKKGEFFGLFLGFCLTPFPRIKTLLEDDVEEKKLSLPPSPQVGRQPLPLVRKVFGLAGDGTVERLEPCAVLGVWLFVKENEFFVEEERGKNEFFFAPRSKSKRKTSTLTIPASDSVAQ